MINRNFTLNENESVSLSVINTTINGEGKEIIPAFTKFSIRRRNLSKTMESVDKTKILPTVFAFAKVDIFRKEKIQLFDFNGEVIPEEVDDKATVLVYLDKADNLNLFEHLDDAIPAEMVECEDVKDAYNRVSTSFALSQIPQKNEWLGLCEATTSDKILSDVRKFVNDHKVNGTVAQAYFGLRFTVSELKKAALSKMSPLRDEDTIRSKEDAERLYTAVSESLTVRAANKTRIARSINSITQKYSIDDVVNALRDMTTTDRNDILEAPCDDRGDRLLAYIGEWKGKQSVKSAA